jgi:hypothetical protein
MIGIHVVAGPVRRRVAVIAAATTTASALAAKRRPRQFNRLQCQEASIETGLVTSERPGRATGVAVCKRP